LTTLTIRNHDIIIGEDASSALLRCVNTSVGDRDVYVISDDNVWSLHGERFKAKLSGHHVHVVTVTPGEASKSVETYLDVISRLMDQGIRRDNMIIGFGGGVVTDLAGFVAATLFRGVRFGSVPTSLLSMVDASIGSKTGIDLPQGKNLIGAFKDPDWVIVDTAYLETLPDAYMTDGLSEVIKAALIGDSMLYRMIETGHDIREETVLMAIEVKRAIVMEDPLESGKRMLLNFGHTFGHAIEKKRGYGTISHGVAVAYGMVIALDLGVKMGITPSKVAHDVKKLLSDKGLVHEPMMRPEDYVDAVIHDKKNLSDGLRFVFLEDIGKAVIKTIRMEDLQ
jgi:3-dehydroquinate synthase